MCANDAIPIPTHLFPIVLLHPDRLGIMSVFTAREKAKERVKMNDFQPRLEEMERVDAEKAALIEQQAAENKRQADEIKRQADEIKRMIELLDQ